MECAAHAEVGLPVGAGGDERGRVEPPLQDNGGVNGLLDAVGVHGPNWLRGETTAMISVVVVQVVNNVGLNMVLFLAALQGVPGDLYEAATIDGAGRWRQFWSTRTGR